MPTDSLDYPIEYAAIPNKDLKPEVFRSFELGLRIDISSQVNIDVSLYHNDIQNLIVTKYINSDSLNNPNSHDKTGIRQNVNSSGAQSRLFGGQLSFNIKDIIPEIRLKTSLTINYAFGDETLPEGKGHLDFFRQMPKYMGNFRISFYPLRKLQLQFDNLLMSSWYRLNIPSEELLKLPYYKVDGYYTLDFLANYQFNKNFSGFMKILNVFDTEYGGIDALGMDIDMHHNPQLGRNIRFGVSYRFE
jgi:outer membrane receptor for ferrienterochelin and colicin